MTPTTATMLAEADRELRRADELLTIAQAAMMPGAPTEVTIRRHIAKGALRVRRIGPHRRIRITRAEFLRYLDMS